MHWYNILAFCVALLAGELICEIRTPKEVNEGAGTNAETRVELLASEEIVKQGDVVTFTCQVHNFQPGQFLRWQKRVPDEEKAINLATNAFLEPLFSDRNLVAEEPTGMNPVIFKLKINGVTYGDQGTFSCSIPTTNSAIEDNVHLTVVREIAMFDFTYTNGSSTQPLEDGTTIKFRNDELAKFTCRAKQANPKPEVTFTIGGKPVDEDLVREELDEHYDILDVKLGTTEQWFTVTKTLEKRISFYDADKTIKCSASIPHALGGQENIKSKSLMIKMEGMPPEINCAGEWPAWEDSNDQVILCNVTAKPPIFNASVTYYRSGKSGSNYLEEIKLGQDDKFKLTIGPHGSSVALRFRTVFKQDFREYNFTVQNDAGKAYKIIRFIRAETNGQYSVNVELSKTTANKGEDLEVTCTVSSDKQEGNENNFPLIVWVKRVEDTEVEIGTNNYLNNDFKKIGRYSANADYEYEDKEMDLSKITFMLTIENVQPQDSGQIGCKIPQQKIEVFREFTVFVPVQSILLNSLDVDGTHAQSYNDKAEMTFDEGHVRKFYCHVNGSFPKPAVSISIGDRDITDQFEREEKVLSKGLVKGLKESTYAVTLKNEAFTIDYSFSNKRLECRATLPGSNFEPKTTGILIKLAGYKPKFDCNKTILVHFLQEDVSIRCTVHAEPKIDHFKIFWSPMPQSVGNISLEGNSSDGHYHADIEDGPGETDKIMVLKIDRIFKQHFRKYYFEAGNSLGKEVFEVDLRQNLTDNENVDKNDGNDESEETGGGPDQAYSVTGGASLTIASMATLLVGFILWTAGTKC